MPAGAVRACAADSPAGSAAGFAAVAASGSRGVLAGELAVAVAVVLEDAPSGAGEALRGAAVNAAGVVTGEDEPVVAMS